MTSSDKGLIGEVVPPASESPGNLITMKFPYPRPTLSESEFLKMGSEILYI